MRNRTVVMCKAESKVRSIWNTSSSLAFRMWRRHCYTNFT